MRLHNDDIASETNQYSYRICFDGTIFSFGTRLTSFQCLPVDSFFLNNDPARRQRILSHIFPHHLFYLSACHANVYGLAEGVCQFARLFALHDKNAQITLRAGRQRQTGAAVKCGHGSWQFERDDCREFLSHFCKTHFKAGKHNERSEYEPLATQLNLQE